jgi:hypothetical protein
VHHDVGIDMKLLSFGGASYLTGTAIADAVLSAGLALARRREMDLVRIPYLDGADVEELEFTIGWMTDVVAVSHIGPEPELVDEAAVSRLRATGGMMGRPLLPVEDPDFAVNNWADYDRRDLGE